MAETEKKISELTTASQINDTDLTILSQGSSGSGFASVKATILAIANKIVSGINFTSALKTENKTITGAINEVAQGGGGGHTIVDNSGTSLAQEPKLKLNGMYVHDDSANQTTVGEYYREMTTAQYNQLSATEKQGAIRLTDNPYVCNINEVENADATHIAYDSNTSVKEKIDTKGTVSRVRGKDGLSGDITTDGYITTDVPRVHLDCNITPIANRVIWQEYTNNSPNTPTNAFYNIVTICGNDTDYATQIAYGLTNEASYYRRRASGSWQSWIKLTP